MKILDLSPYFHTAIQALQEWSEDPSLMFGPSAQSVFGEEILVQKDQTYRSLLAGADSGTAANILSDLCSKAVEVLKSQLSSQLPGFNFYNVYLYLTRKPPHQLFLGHTV